MLLVKTKLAQSAIHGMGLFADQCIPSGTTVWKFHEGYDIEYTDAQLDVLEPVPRAQMGHFVYVNPENGLAILCGDNARFMNHSHTPNTHSAGGHGHDGITVASRDIQVGEELTCNYDEFDAAWNKALRDSI